jgi:hypothetical protein
METRVSRSIGGVTLSKSGAADSTQLAKWSPEFRL